MKINPDIYFTLFLVVGLAWYIFATEPKHRISEREPYSPDATERIFDELDEELDRMWKEVWVQESSPSDRRVILGGITAIECLDMGVCSLAVGPSYADVEGITNPKCNDLTDCKQ